MTKEIRLKVYDKCGGHCAYCGREIEFRDMQVDHVSPKHIGSTDDIQNLNPACRRCNHYKRAHSLETYRELISKLHTKIRDIYICKTAEDYGIIEVKEWDGRFYLERMEGEK